MPKGEKIKAKATGSSATCEFQKIIVFSTCLLIKTLLLQNYSLIGEKFDYGWKGEFFTFDLNRSWKMFWFAKQSVFHVEVRKWICIAKINQVVAKWSKYTKSCDNSIGF
jgi:hypothetical protein